MKNLRIFLVSFFAFNGVSATLKEVICPDYCRCDMLGNLRRATCSNRKLFSVEIDVPIHVQILDLSYNQVSELGDKIFLEIGLNQLKLLNISHNKLSQIHLNGFEGLQRLKTLDLSFNALGYFLKSWFDSLTSLEELYLRGNHLRAINEKPHIEINTLKLLDISQCGITHLRSNTFRKTPNLEILDVSGNFLTHFKPETLKHLTSLKRLNLKDNNFNCEENQLGDIKNYTKIKNILMEDQCPLRKSLKKQKMFEEIVMEEERNSWMIEEEEKPALEILENCTLSNGTNLNGNFVMEVMEMSPWLAVFFIFSSGMFTGLLLGCSIQCYPKNSNEDNCVFPDGRLNMRNAKRLSVIGSRQNRKSVTRTRSKSFVSKFPRDDVVSLMISEYDLANSTPMNPRKIYL